MPLRADCHNYRKAFKRNIKAYRILCDSGGSSKRISKELMLVYAVECGLKCLLMKKARIEDATQAVESLKVQLRTHNFLQLLNELKQSGQYNFKPFYTEYGERVDANTYHQICRYNIMPDNGSLGTARLYEQQLSEIAEWIEREVITNG